MNWHPESSKPVFYCALGLLAAFLMPWVQFFGAGLSGYNLGQFGSYGTQAWAVPVLAGATVLATASGANNRYVGAAAGAVPLLMLLYWGARLGDAAGSQGINGVLELAKQALAVGAWLTIGLCVAIIAFAVAKDGSVAVPAGAEASGSATPLATPFAGPTMGLDAETASIIERLKSIGVRVEVREGGRFLALMHAGGGESYVHRPGDVRKVAEANKWV